MHLVAVQGKKAEPECPENPFATHSPVGTIFERPRMERATHSRKAPSLSVHQTPTGTVHEGCSAPERAANPETDRSRSDLGHKRCNINEYPFCRKIVLPYQKEALSYRGVCVCHFKRKYWAWS